MPHKLNIYTSIFIYLTAAFVFLPYTSCYFNSTDLAQYYSIALKYRQCDFSDAVNLYWPPLYSWLLIPFIFLFDNLMLGAQALNLIIGLGLILLLFQFDLLKQKLSWLTLPVFIALPICVISFALMFCGPDLLFTAVIVFTIYKLNRLSDGLVTKKNMMQIAMCGVLLYLSKSIGLYVFVCFLLIFVFYQKKESVLIFFGTLSLFFLFCFPWIICLSVKNGAFTLGANGAYNFALITPENFNPADPALRHPFFADQFLPFTGQGFCAWEWPHQFLSIPLSKYFTLDFLRHYLLVILNNFKSVYYIFIQNNFGLVAIFIFLVFVFSRQQEMKAKNIFLIVLFFVPLLLYVLIFVHYRYLFLILIGALLLFCYVLNNNEWMGRSLFKLVYTLVIYTAIVLLVKRPLKELFFKTDQDIASSQMLDAVARPFETLENTYSNDLKLYKAIVEMGNIYENKSFCGIKASGDEYSYNAFLEAAMLSRMKYFGEKIYRKDIRREIERAAPDYIICTGQSLSEMKSTYPEKKFFRINQLDYWMTKN